MASVSAVVSAVATTVDDAAPILAGLQRIAGVLKTPRAGVLIGENYTKRQLTRIWEHHVHGGFAVTPSALIAAKGVNVYGAQNQAMSIGTGTEGAVIYQPEGEERLAFSLDRENPCSGPNKCGAFLGTILPSAAPAGLPPLFVPYRDDAFNVGAAGGAGGREVEMRFELLKGESSPAQTSHQTTRLGSRTGRVLTVWSCESRGVSSRPSRSNDT